MMSALLLCLLMHPFHVSLTEAQWNQQTQRFELAMRFEPRDLQQALSRHAEKRIDLEKADPAEAQAVIMAYVKAKFPVKDAQDRAARWHWVGLENETKYVWIFLELEPPEASTRLHLTNRMLHEIAPTQINTILLTGTAEKQTLRFSKSQAKQTLIRTAADWRLSETDASPVLNP